MRAIRSILFVLWLSAGTAVRAEVPFAATPYICDSMILQRDIPLNITGTAPAGRKITVEFAGSQAEAVSSPEGEWCAVLPPLPACNENRDMTVKCGDRALVVKDILVGDVWFAGGQSNMAFQVRSLAAEERLALAREAEFPSVRYYYRAGVVGGGKLLDKPDKPWRGACGRGIYDWSAIAYVFAKELYRDYGVPVGIVSCSHGGSTAEAWISSQAYDGDPELRASVGKYHEGLQALHRDPSSLYTAMMEMFEGISVKGVIWYQGEANGLFPEKYYKTFSSLIADWRRFFRNENLPFLFAQLPSYAVTNDPTHEKWARLRREQYRVWQDTPHTAMIVTAEYGDPEDIHPRNKIPVAERFIAAAKAEVYGEEIHWHVGLPEKARLDDGEVIAEIEHVAGKLSAGKNEPRISVCGADGIFHPAECTVKGNAIKIKCPAAAHPVKVRYAWGNVCELSLYDKKGIPVPPFELEIDH